MDHNARPNVSFTLGINEFADMSEEEFQSKKTGLISIDESEPMDISILKNLQSFPKEKDWRKENIMGPVMD